MRGTVLRDMLINDPLGAKLINLVLTAKNFEASWPVGPGGEMDSKAESFDIDYLFMGEVWRIFPGHKNQAPGTGLPGL
jgi:hypothetical protein